MCSGSLVSRFVDRDMLVRFHWGLGVGHTYSHAPSSEDDNQPFPVTENCAAEQAMMSHSSEQMSVSSQPQNPIASSSAVAGGDDPNDEFVVLPQWEGSGFEWEAISDSESTSNSESTSDSEENVDIQTMYAAYDDGLESD